MASDPLLTNFFGPGVTQDATTLVINKNDLVAPVGLTPSYEFTPAANNRSEQLFTAILLRAERNQDQSTDSQLVITKSDQSLEFRFGKWQRKYAYTIEIYIDDTVSTLPNPNLV